VSELERGWESISVVVSGSIFTSKTKRRIKRVELDVAPLDYDPTGVAECRRAACRCGGDCSRPGVRVTVTPLRRARFFAGGPPHKQEGRMSKVKMLVDAGLLDENELTDEHKQTIEQETTLEEIEVIIRVGKKLVGHPKVGHKKVGCSL
jgi:hypothetical protein